MDTIAELHPERIDRLKHAGYSVGVFADRSVVEAGVEFDEANVQSWADAWDVADRHPRS